jgi:hypothetical protein
MLSLQKAETSVDVICQTAGEFLHLLNPVGGLFGSGHIFRGVSRISHDLIPAAHRVGTVLYNSEHETCDAPQSGLLDQCAAEYHTINKFFSIAARHGIRIPEDSFELRRRLDEWGELFGKSNPALLEGHVWPSPDLFSLVALAQHYRVPTRALDWTWSSYTAAYFAARPALGSDTPTEEIAVWAFDDFTRQIDQIIDPSSERPLLVFTVSGADNDNLKAQRGLFMIHPQQFGPAAAPFAPNSYDRLLLQGMPALRDAARIVRIAVSHSEATKVLALLTHAGVTTGSLHPGLWGVAREYEDEQLICPGFIAPNATPEIQDLWERICTIADQNGA